MLLSLKFQSEDEAQARYYGWVVVAASVLILVVGVPLITQTVSVLLKPLVQEFGWSRGSISLIYSAGVAGMAIGGIVMGRLADKATTRRIASVGVIALAVCAFGASQATALWHFYAFFFIGGFIGAGSLFTPLIANVGSWFKSNVGLAIGITTSGQAAGYAVIPYVLSLLIEEAGWRAAFLVMGGATLAIILPLSMLIRDPVGKSEAAKSNRVDLDTNVSEVISPNLAVAWLSVAVIFCCICMTVPLMHLVPLIQDRGHELADAASVLSVLFISAAVGRIAFGRLSDRIGPVAAYLTASIWQTALVFLFIHMQSLASFYATALIFGFGYAGVMTTIMICIRTLTPISRRATSVGIVGFFGWVGHAIGSYQAGLFFDLYGSYTVAFATAAISGAINLILVGALFVHLRRPRLVSSFLG